jgi:2-aminoadipate transaminase
VTLSAERRQALVELAQKYGFLVVEDVAYRELGFDGEALPSLWSLAPDVVAQIGTTSKTFFPGVRLGWAVGPAEIVSQLVVAKQNTDQCAGALGQKLFEEYARRGALDEQLVHSRALYRRRCERMLAAFERTMPAGVTWTRPHGGFFSWVTLPEGVDAAELARSAATAGVAVVPGSPFFPDGRGGSNLRLSFSRVEDELIDEGIERLAALVTDGGGRQQ